MLISRWRERSHPHFGTVQVPIVEVEIKSGSGAYFPFAMCIDSGAVVSLLPSSAADVLGLNLESGRPVQLAGVGHHATNAWIHELELRLADLPIAACPFAIAGQDNVPALLGRLGLFDRFEITFDPAKHETRILQP